MQAEDDHLGEASSGPRRDCEGLQRFRAGLGSPCDTSCVRGTSEAGDRRLLADNRQLGRFETERRKQSNGVPAVVGGMA